MTFRPNYNQQRAERDRLKQVKKDAKLREKANAREQQKLASETPVASSKMPDEVPPTE